MSANEGSENTDLEKTLHHLLTTDTHQEQEQEQEQEPEQEQDQDQDQEQDQDPEKEQQLEKEGQIHNVADTDPEDFDVKYPEIDNEDIQCSDIGILDSDIMQGKHLTLESLLESGDSMMFDLDDTPKKRLSNEIDVDQDFEASNKRKKLDTAAYEQLLSPASLSPLSTDGNTNTNNNSILSKIAEVKSVDSYTNDFTIEQIKEMKKRIINTHKLFLNFNLLKDSYSKTCVEFKKVLNILKDSEIHRSHLLKENQELTLKLDALTK